MSIVDKAKAALDAAGMGHLFIVRAHPDAANLVQVEHNARRASAGHEGEDMHAAGRALGAAGFSGWLFRWTLTMRESTPVDKAMEEANGS